MAIMRRFAFNCTRNYVSWTSGKNKESALMKNILYEFDKYTPKVIDNTLAKATYIDSADIKDRVKRLSEYYTVGRKPVQGEFMVFAYEAFANSKTISKELLHQIQVVVSTVEMVQSYFFFWDDLEDDCDLRCDKPCWHLVDNAGTLAYNDASIVRSLIDECVRDNFQGELRENILKIYNRIYFIASIGQYFDTIVSRSKNFDDFTMDNYNRNNIYKSSMYAIKSPLLLALSLSNNLTEESQKIVDEIGNDIGILIQIHNDFLDYYHATGSVLGKSGTDISVGKCSWSAVAALQNCNPAQRRVFYENYGTQDPEKAKRIYDLYKELDLPGLYKKEEEARYNIFLKKVKSLPKNATPSADFLMSFSDLIRQYTKNTANLMYDK